MLKKGTWLRFHWGWAVVGKEGDGKVGGRKEGEVESVSCCFLHTITGKPPLSESGEKHSDMCCITMLYLNHRYSKLCILNSDWAILWEH